eukprot:gene11244-23517_t
MVNDALLRLISFSVTVMLSVGFMRRSIATRQLFSSVARKMATVGQEVPSGVLVDIVETSTGDAPCKMNEAQDLGSILKAHKRAVLFAVPGAFTPTCSAQHLPGFISKSEEFYAKGVEAIYCFSVNDRFVMRSWAENTPGCVESKIKMVADGNGDFTAALGLTKDATGSRMGVRSKRFAAIIENGTIMTLNIDEKGLVESSAEKMLALL